MTSDLLQVTYTYMNLLLSTYYTYHKGMFMNFRKNLFALIFFFHFVTFIDFIIKKNSKAVSLNK